MDEMDSNGLMFTIQLPYRKYVLRSDSQEELRRWHSSCWSAASAYRLGGSRVDLATAKTPGSAEGASIESEADGLSQRTVMLDPSDVDTNAMECQALMILRRAGDTDDETEVKNALHIYLASSPTAFQLTVGVPFTGHRAIDGVWSSSI